jgi:hypothetical protein
MAGQHAADYGANRRPPPGVTVSKEPHASNASAWERRKLTQVVARPGAGPGPSLPEDLRHDRSDGLDARDE